MPVFVRSSCHGGRPLDERYRARRSYAPEGAEQHRAWLSLIEVSGPFLSLPVLRSTWPTPVDRLAQLCRHHDRFRGV